MNINEELKLYNNAKDALEAMPNDLRSQNHSNYLSELDLRIYENMEHIKFIRNRAIEKFNKNKNS